MQPLMGSFRTKRYADNGKYWGSTAAILAAALLASGCAGEDPNADGGSDTTQSLSSNSGSEVSAAGLVAPYPLEELPEEGKRAAVLNLVEDVHGPTDNVSKEVNRLIYFPEFETPTGASIVKVRANLDLFSGDEKLNLNSAVGIMVDTDAEALATFFDASLAKDGWTLERQEAGSDLDGFETIERDFTRNGDSYDLGERLEVSIAENTDVSKRVVTLDFSSSNFTDTAMFDRFNGWHGEIPLPDGMEHHESGIATSFNNGQTSTVFSADFRVPESDISGPELIAQTVTKTEAMGLEYNLTGDSLLAVSVEEEGRDSPWRMGYFATNSGDTGLFSVSGQIPIAP